MRVGVYPGSFDPTTNGHLDLIHRGMKLVDKLVVGVLNNTNKQPLFSVQERVTVLEELTKDMPNVIVDSFTGLLVDFIKRHNAHIIIRGLRAVSDFEYELQMAQTNYTLDREIETIFLVTRVENSYLSSSIVKDIAKFGGHFENMVPESIVKKIKYKYNPSAN